MPRISNSSTTIRTISAASIILSAGILTACGSEDDLAGVQEGRDVLVRFSSSAPDTTRESAYGKAKSAASSADSDGAVSGAASLLKGVSDAGLAQLQLADAAALGKTLGDKVRFLRDLTLAHESATVMLDELRRYDVDRDIKELDNRLNSHRNTLQQAKADEDDANSKRAAMQSEIAGLQQSAESLRAQESQIRNQALRTDVVQRAEVIERANKVRREADAIEQQIDLQQLDLSSVDRMLADAKLAITAAERLIEINERSRRAMQDRAAELESAASAASRRVAELETQIAEQASDLSQFLTSEFDPTIEQVLSQYGTAQGGSNRGSSAGRVATSGAQAIVHRGITKANMIAAIGYESVSSIASRVASRSISTTLDANAANTKASGFRSAAGEALSQYADSASSAASSGGEIDSSIQALQSLAQELQGIDPQATADDFSAEDDMATDDFQSDTETEESWDRESQPNESQSDDEAIEK